MSQHVFSFSQIETLAALAQGIIPRDDRDDGAAMFDPGKHLAQKMEAERNNAALIQGLEFAEATSQANFGRAARQLDAPALENLLAIVRERSPAFFKFLRAEICALYLSQPAVWKRIGFAGPSIQTGGHPDFDQPQHG
jgi:hypothetical protein